MYSKNTRAVYAISMHILVSHLCTLWLLFFTGLSVAYATPADGVAPASQASTVTISQLRSLVQQKMSLSRDPGAIVFVQSHALGTWTETFGTSDLATGAPLATAMHIRIGSITKTLIATVILQLVQEGKLHLNDPISAYQPQVPNGKHITLREILNMTSGLYNYSDDPAFVATLTKEVEGIDAGRVWSPQTLLNIAFKHHPYFAPGKGLHYSNTNYILLGVLIRQITGNSPAEEIQRRIFTPLAMTHSLIPEPDATTLLQPYARGYAFKTPLLTNKHAPPAEAPLDATFVNPSWGGTAGDAISTLADLKIWVKALVQGTLLSPELQKERLTFVGIPGVADTTASYGLGIVNFYHGFIGHNGALPGYQSFAVYNPGQDTTVIVLTNLYPDAQNSGPADAIAQAIIHHLTQSDE